MKSQYGIILVLTLSCPLLFSAIPLGKAQSGTQVSGIIGSDATWTKENSPYTFTANVGIPKSLTLTIAPGVTVNLGNYFLQINGTLKAQGSSLEPICLNSNNKLALIFQGIRNESNDSNSVIEECVVTSMEIEVSYASPIIRNNSFSNCYIYVYQGSPAITDNVVVDIGSSSYSIYLHDSNATVSGNLISGAQTGIGISNMIYLSTPVVADNLVIGNSYYGIVVRAGLYTFNPTIRNNTITNNYGGVRIYSDTGASNLSPQIVFNNIYNNTEYNMVLDLSTNINATYNWWGTTDTQAINQTIYDFKNDFTLGKIEFAPYLTSLNPNAPAEREPPIIPETPPFLIMALILAILASFLLVLRRKLEITSIFAKLTPSSSNQLFPRCNLKFLFRYF